MKVSIVTVTYNCLDDFRKTFGSVLAQTYPDVEYIVIDGASNDGTADFIRGHGEAFAYWVSEPDKGIYDAMNKGLAAATGDWVLMLNAGDVFYDDGTLAEVFSQDYSDADVVYGDYVNLLESGPFLDKATCPFFENPRKLHGMGFGHQSVFIRTGLSQSIKYDLSYKCCADYAHMVTLYRNGARYKHIDIPIVIAEGRYGFSERHRALQLREEARICGVDRTLLFKLYYVYFCVRRYLRKLLKPAVK